MPGRCSALPRALGFRAPPKSLLVGIYNSFVEGNTTVTADSYLFLVQDKAQHLPFDRFNGRSLWWCAVLHGRAQMVELGITDCPKKGKLITQDLLDTALLVVCAQDTPSIETIKVLCKHGADINARWDPVYRLKKHKDTPRELRKRKKRGSARHRRLLSRYTSHRRIVEGDTPLILACRKRPRRHRTRVSTSELVRVVRCCRALGADHTIRNSMGHDAFVVALESQFFRVCFQQLSWWDPSLERLLGLMQERLDRMLGRAMPAVEEEDEGNMKKKTKTKTKRKRKKKKGGNNNDDEDQRVETSLDDNDVALCLLSANAFESTGSAEAPLPSQFVCDLELRCTRWLATWEHRVQTLPAHAKPEGAEEPVTNPGKKQPGAEGEEDCSDELAADIRANEENDDEEREEERGKTMKNGGDARIDGAAPNNAFAAFMATAPAENVDDSSNEMEVRTLEDVGNASFEHDLKRMRALTQHELVPFIAFLLLDMANRGFMPNNPLTKSFHPNFAQHLRNLGTTRKVCNYLLCSCSVLLTSILRQELLRFKKLLRKNSPESCVGWSETLTLCRCLYQRIWRASRPKHPGAEEFKSAELEREIVAARNLEVQHYMERLLALHTFDRLAELPPGWTSMQDLDRKTYYLHIKTRKTSRQRPTNEGRSFA